MFFSCDCINAKITWVKGIYNTSPACSLCLIDLEHGSSVSVVFSLFLLQSAN